MRETRTSGSMSGKWNRSLTGNRATSRLDFNADVSIPNSREMHQPPFFDVSAEVIKILKAVLTHF